MTLLQCPHHHQMFIKLDKWRVSENVFLCSGSRVERDIAGKGATPWLLQFMRAFSFASNGILCITLFMRFIKSMFLEISVQLEHNMRQVMREPSFHAFAILKCPKIYVFQKTHNFTREFPFYAALRAHMESKSPKGSCTATGYMSFHPDSRMETKCLTKLSDKIE